MTDQHSELHADIQQHICSRFDNLKTYFMTHDGVVRAVDGVSIDIAPRKRWAWSANRAAARQ